MGARCWVYDARWRHRPSSIGFRKFDNAQPLRHEPRKNRVNQLSLATFMQQRSFLFHTCHMVNGHKADCAKFLLLYECVVCTTKRACGAGECLAISFLALLYKVSETIRNLWEIYIDLRHTDVGMRKLLVQTVCQRRPD